MTEKQMEQIFAQLPEGETPTRMYIPFEGGLRMITEDKNGHEKRYEVTLDKNENIKIQER